MQTMKYFLLLSLMLLIGCSDLDRKTINLPEKIRNLPVGIEVKHSVDTAYASLNDTLSRWGKYKWSYATTVSTMDKELRIIEFGGLIEENNSWVERTIRSRPFNNREFEKWYGAPDGVLKTGKEYTDNNNWSMSNNLGNRESKVVWYFIGVDKEGKKFVGYELITNKPELK